jgi:hypothetical protein
MAGGQRWAAEAISFVDPHHRRCLEILGQMDAAFNRRLPADRKRTDPEFFAYFNPVMLDSKTLVVEGMLTQDGGVSDVAYDYRLQYRIQVKNGNPVVTLTKSRPMPKDELDPGDMEKDYSVEEIQQALKESYAKLLAQSSPATRRLLRKTFVNCRRSAGCFSPVSRTSVIALSASNGLQMRRFVAPEAQNLVLFGACGTC